MKVNDLVVNKNCCIIDHGQIFYLPGIAIISMSHQLIAVSTIHFQDL